jgi:hypothetical protein
METNTDIENGYIYGLILAGYGVIYIDGKVNNYSGQRNS